MKKRLELLVFTIFVSLIFAVSCGGNDEDTVTDNDSSGNVSDDLNETDDSNDETVDNQETTDDSKEDDTAVTDSDNITNDEDVADDEGEDFSEDADNENPDEGNEDDAQCSEIVADFHAGDRYIIFSTFSTATEAPSCYDLSMTKYDGGPAYFLGENSDNETKVTAIDLGSEVTFASVEAAPAEGYGTDDLDNMNLIIGSGWRVAGGTGSVGFEMTNNVYVVKTCDQKYAKIIFTYGKAGTLKMNVCYQADGSTNLKGDVE